MGFFMDFYNLNIISWNVSGHIKELVRRFSPSFFFLMETHVAFDRVKLFWTKLGYEAVKIIEAQGHSGGIWILSSKQSICCNVLSCFNQAIIVEFSRGRSKWLCTVVYASPIPSQRELLWDYLQEVVAVDGGVPWLVVGDFNEILLPSEVKGGDFYPRRAANFMDVLDRCRLLDLGAVGGRFTWFRSIQGGRFVSKRLDRAIANYFWRSLFKDAFCGEFVQTSF